MNHADEIAAARLTLEPEAESPVERASHAIVLAVADLYVAIESAQSVDEALKLRDAINPLTQMLVNAESAALRKAESL